MKKGFTLLELLIVVLIAGILVSFAVPAYMAAKRRASANEAVANLRAMIGAEKSRRLLKPFGLAQCACTGAGTAAGQCNYNPGGAGGIPGCNVALSMQLNPVEWAYRVDFTSSTGGIGNDFAAIATRKSGGCVYRVDVTGDVIRFGAFNETLSSSGGDCPF